MKIIGTIVMLQMEQPDHTVNAEFSKTVFTGWKLENSLSENFLSENVLHFHTCRGNGQEYLHFFKNSEFHM